MQIEVIYCENGSSKKLTLFTYEELGYWIANNYYNIKINDIITLEE